MGLDLAYIDGQTPLDEDEREGLLIPTISTRAELDEFEQLNIEQAVQWGLMLKIKADSFFKEDFMRKVHKQMFGEVWNWAGEFRTTNKNIGVDKWQIGTELKCMLDDGRHWHEHQIYSPDEMAMRFKHRMVSIHCFPNGNGRHSRFVADLIIEKICRLPVFSWGVEKLNSKGVSRMAYLQAVKAADRGDINPLLLFARS